MSEIKEIIKMEKEVLLDLLNLLNRQYEYLLKRALYDIDNISRDISETTNKIAQIEMKRRNLLKGQHIKEIINQSDDEELINVYKDIRKIVNNIKVQKETNDLLIKQEIFYTNKIINLLNPSHNTKTYNSNGSINRR